MDRCLTDHLQPDESNEMQKLNGAVSYRTLSAQLKELEKDGLIHRKEYPQIPPKVEYRLSDKGKTLVPIMNALCEWGMTHHDNYS